MKILLLAASILCLPLSPSSAVEKAGETRQQLQEIERRIEQTVRSLGEKKAQARSLAEDLAAVSQTESRLQRRISTLEKNRKDLERRLAEQQSQVTSLQQQAGQTEQLVRRRLVALYKGGEMGALRVLFAAGTPNRMAEDFDFLGRIVRRDRELLADYRTQLAELETAHRQLAELHEEQQTALKELRSEQEDLQRAVRLKKKLLARVERDEAELGRVLADLRERAARLGSLLKRLESQKTREYTQLDGPFARQKGRLPWPVDGKVRIGFGTSRHPDLGTLHDSQGIEIAVAPGGAVQAVWPGRVIYADSFKGFGNLLILDHGDGFYTLYAQASQLTRRVGDQVAAGDTIARSGFEGAGGLYFEVRHHGVPQNPTDWLLSR